MLVGGSGDTEESEHGALSGIELGFEDFDGSPVSEEVVAGEVGEDVEDARRVLGAGQSRSSG